MTGGSSLEGPEVVIAEDRADIAAAIDEALRLLPLERLVRGKLVAVKPNETWASRDDRSGVTQPEALRAVLRAVRKHEPRAVVVSGGAGAAETHDVFEVAGLMEVVREEGVEYFDHNRPPFVDVSLDYGADPEVEGPQQTIKVNPRVLEYETLIALNQLKLHSTATVTLALKNIAMSYPAADYYGHPRKNEDNEHWFFDDMHSFIAAMARRFPIDLAITVGHPAMIATGPLGGKPVETGLVIASTDALAADVVGAQLFGFSIQAVRHLWEAQRLGVGEGDLQKVRFPLMDVKDAIERFTEAAYGQAMTFEHA